MDGHNGDDDAYNECDGNGHHDKTTTQHDDDVGMRKKISITLLAKASESGVGWLVS